jgi:pilus assembly protein Flp/PilA
VIKLMVLATIMNVGLALLRRDDEDGQGLAEYALILALIAIVAIVALLFLGNQVSDKLSVIGGTLQSYQP